MKAALKQAKQFYKQGQMRLALVAANHAIADNSSDPESMLMLATIHEKLGDLTHAAIYYAGVIDLSPRHRREAAFLSAKHFLAVNDAPSALGAMHMLERYLPDDVNLNHSLCSLYREARDYARALPYARVLAKRGQNFGNWLNAGIVLAGLHLHEEALGPLTKAWKSKPGDRLALSELFSCASNLADLELTSRLQSELEAAYAREGDDADIRENAFRALLWSADEEYHLRCARRTAREILPPVSDVRPQPRRNRDKIRVGYVSADFRNHATMALFAGVLEAHDRDKFEIYGVCHTPENQRQGEMRGRFLDAIDRYVDILNLDDEAAANLLRSLELDILVDLKGFTEDCRLGIFCRRPAPVQVTYLGFPGSVAGAGIDYALTDGIVTPASSEPFYEEKLLRLQPSYQCNDVSRPAFERTGNRTRFDLPETGIVFSSFNQMPKLREPVFAAWMEVLRAIEGSVLWLTDAPETAKGNLRKAATGHGVDPSRLIFAPMLPLDKHLERLAEVDIALDTGPCNGHTTTSDALWCGVPVVTFQGSNFAGRVSESLLRAVGLDELVADDLPAFVELAIELANDSDRRTRLHQHLVEARKTSPLFDTVAITRQIESHFANIVDANG